MAFLLRISITGRTTELSYGLASKSHIESVSDRLEGCDNLPGGRPVAVLFGLDCEKSYMDS